MYVCIIYPSLSSSLNMSNLVPYQIANTMAKGLFPNQILTQSQKYARNNLKIQTFVHRLNSVTDNSKIVILPLNLNTLKIYIIFLS